MSIILTNIGFAVKSVLYCVCENVDATKGWTSHESADRPGGDEPR